MKEPRFEIVRVDGGWFVRFVAANGRIVWVTPGLHARRRAAIRAIELVTGSDGGNDRRYTYIDRALCEIRDVDERGAA